MELPRLPRSPPISTRHPPVLHASPTTKRTGWFTSSSSHHDSSTTGSRHDSLELQPPPSSSMQDELPATQAPRPRLACCLPGNQTKTLSSPVRRVASAGHNCLLICSANIHRSVLCGLSQSGVRVLLSKRRLPEIPCIVIPSCVHMHRSQVAWAGFSKLKSHTRFGFTAGDSRGLAPKKKVQLTDSYCDTMAPAFKHPTGNSVGGL